MRVVIVLMAAWLSTSPARTAVYRDRSVDPPVKNTYTVSDTASGHRIEMDLPGVGGRHVIETDASWSTTRWVFRAPGKKIDIEARRRGDRVVLAGTHDGEKVRRDYELDGKPWHQAFPLDLEAFAASGEPELRFVAIAPEGPSALKLGGFAAERRQKASLRVNGAAVEAVHLRVGLTGLLSMFWHGDYWHRVSDGRFVRYGGAAPGDEAITELVEER